MRRGEIWVANLNPNRGREVKRARPVLVMQNDALTALDTGLVIVLPLTTQGRPWMQNFRPRIPARDRLIQDSYVVVEQPRTLDRASFGEGPLTILTEEELITVERGLGTALGMT